MPLRWADLTSRLSFPLLTLLGIAACLALYPLVRRLLRRRISPGEAEKRRRQAINKNGKLGDGEIIDIEGNAIVYSYYVGGVGYTTSQDAGTLEAMLPEDRMAIVGPVSVKFLPANPANSIVLCEGWSGLRNRDPRQAGGR